MDEDLFTAQFWGSIIWWLEFMTYGRKY